MKLQEAMQEAGKGIQQVVADVRQECVDIQAASHRVHRMVDTSRRALDRTFQTHVEACRSAPPSTSARRRCGAKNRKKPYDRYEKKCVVLGRNGCTWRGRRAARPSRFRTDGVQGMSAFAHVLASVSSSFWGVRGLDLRGGWSREEAAGRAPDY